MLRQPNRLQQRPRRDLRWMIRLPDMKPRSNHTGRVKGKDWMDTMGTAFFLHWTKESEIGDCGWKRRVTFFAEIRFIFFWGLRPGFFFSFLFF